MTDPRKFAIELLVLAEESQEDWPGYAVGRQIDLIVEGHFGDEALEHIRKEVARQVAERAAE